MKQSPESKKTAVLAISQSTAHCSIAIVQNGKSLASQAWDSKMINNHDIFKSLPVLFTQASVSPENIDIFAVDIGPGSFAGIRTAISTANGMALPDKKTVIGISCGAAIAHEILTSSPEALVTVIGDARRQLLWHAEFKMIDGSATLTKDYSLVTKEELPQILPPTSILATPDWHRLNDFLSKSLIPDITLINKQSVPTAELIAHLALHQNANTSTQPTTALPLYMHPPVHNSSSGEAFA